MIKIKQTQSFQSFPIPKPLVPTVQDLISPGYPGDPIRAPDLVSLLILAAMSDVACNKINPRAANEPSQRLKFYNHVEGPY